MTVEVTVKVVLVLWRVVSLVDIVTLRPDTEIQARVLRSGEKVSVSVKVQSVPCVQAGIVKL